MANPMRSVVVRQVTEDRVRAVLQFHKQHVTQHLWPRTLANMKTYAEAGMLWEAVEIPSQGAKVKGERLVGVCYVALEYEPGKPNVERNEFGGVFLTEDCRGTGLASVLGRVALIALWATDPPTGRLIAHVHEANELPRKMLEALGFTDSNKPETPPREAVPKSMLVNGNGDVVGDVFVFDRAHLAKFADWLQGYNGSAVIGGGTVQVAVPTVRALNADRALTIEAFRDLATEKPAFSVMERLRQSFARFFAR